MGKVKKILAPTDLSELSQTGMRYALEMAGVQGAEVIAYHIIGAEEATPYYYPESMVEYSSRAEFKPVPEILEERRKLLADFLRENFAELLSKVKIRQEVDIGLPYKMIVGKAAEEGVDMIVMSTHGRTGILHALIGSVTEKVVRLATCPVLSVRPTQESKLAEAAARSGK